MAHQKGFKLGLKRESDKTRLTGAECSSSMPGLGVRPIAIYTNACSTSNK